MHTYECYLASTDVIWSSKNPRTE